MAILFFVIFILCLISYYYLFLHHWEKNWKKGLKVEVSFSKHTIFEGETFYLKEKISNKSKQLHPFLQVSVLFPPKGFQARFEGNNFSDLQRDLQQIFSLSQYEEKEKQIEIKGNRRGIYYFSKGEVVDKELLVYGEGSFPFSLYDEIVVYPKWVSPLEIAKTWEDTLGDLLVFSSLYDDPLMIRNIRPIEPQDSFRQINWKKSATNGELYVNKYEAVSNAVVTLVLFLPEKVDWRHEGLLEYSISILVTVARECLEKGYILEILSNAAYANGENLIFSNIQNIDVLLYGCAGIDFNATKSPDFLYNQLQKEEVKKIIVCSSGKELYRPLKNLLDNNPFYEVSYINAVEDNPEIHPKGENVREVLVK